MEELNDGTWEEMRVHLGMVKSDKTPGTQSMEVEVCKLGKLVERQQTFMVKGVW